MTFSNDALVDRAREMCITQRAQVLLAPAGPQRVKEYARYAGMVKMADSVLDLPDGFETAVEQGGQARYEELQAKMVRSHRGEAKSPDGR